MNQSLEGLRVIDFTQIAAGPTCTMMLADRGADVIKIEPPSGELGRQLGPPWIEGHSVIQLALNRNKRGIILDLKDPADVEFAQSLIDDADIVVESFRPGVMERLGLGYPALKTRHPGLIYCSISAYGQAGADCARPGVDGAIQAVSGLMSTTGFADGPPTKMQAPVIDMVTGFFATIAILDALLLRSQGGAGKWLDVSMYSCAMQLQQTALASYLTSRDLPERTGNAAPYSAPNEVYETADGWLLVAAYHPARWKSFCVCLKMPHLTDDHRFATSPLRVANRHELTTLIAPTLKQRTTQQWVETLSSVDIICSPVLDYQAATRSEQFKRAGLSAQVMQPGIGEMRVVPPMTFEAASGSTPNVLRPAPTLGEHTDEIRATYTKRTAQI
ncbi:CaiB/BaiF CoA transferase family protein [Cupriavidus basilensis]|uniref:CaiB/BaiF CoA transferase family protein n=1 Tax=Cupriavidus basilensis TaxID=68895 RepID=UPI0023E8E4A7|nr:CoA transferase [Cupriavidus basilensis]MDF3883008.1 CoA transferase [Cupriavidus basilensis]